MKINLIQIVDNSNSFPKAKSHYRLIEGNLAFNQENGTLKFTTKSVLVESFELKFARLIEVSETIMSFSGVKKVGMSSEAVLVDFTTVGL